MILLILLTTVTFVSWAYSTTALSTPMVTPGAPSSINTAACRAGGQVLSGVSGTPGVHSMVGHCVKEVLATNSYSRAKSASTLSIYSRTVEQRRKYSVVQANRTPAADRHAADRLW
jgi:hypothetical protein